ncbi:MAG: class I SAM-dependent methyltransferase [bacterium]
MDPAPPDWRFLLPVDEKSRVLELAGRDDVALAFAYEIAQVVALRDSFDAGERLTATAASAGLSNVDLLLGTLEEPPGLDGLFQAIVLHDALDQPWRPPSAPGADERLLGTLRRALAPSGALWIAARNHAFGPRGAEGLQRVLRRAGFAALEIWALLPNAERPLELVPLDSPSAFDFVTDRGQIGGRGTWATALAKRAFRAGLAPRFIPAFGIVARAGGPR